MIVSDMIWLYMMYIYMLRPLYISCICNTTTIDIIILFLNISRLLILIDQFNNNNHQNQHIFPPIKYLPAD